MRYLILLVITMHGFLMSCELPDIQRQKELQVQLNEIEAERDRRVDSIQKAIESEMAGSTVKEKDDYSEYLKAKKEYTEMPLIDSITVLGFRFGMSGKQIEARLSELEEQKVVKRSIERQGEEEVDLFEFEMGGANDNIYCIGENLCHPKTGLVGTRIMFYLKEDSDVEAEMKEALKSIKDTSEAIDKMDYVVGGAILDIEEDYIFKYGQPAYRLDHLGAIRFMEGRSMSMQREDLYSILEIYKKSGKIHLLTVYYEHLKGMEKYLEEVDEDYKGKLNI